MGSVYTRNLQQIHENLYQKTPCCTTLHIAVCVKSKWIKGHINIYATHFYTL